MDDELREYTRTLFNTTGNRLTVPADIAPPDAHRELLDYFKALTEPKQTPDPKD